MNLVGRRHDLDRTQSNAGRFHIADHPTDAFMLWRGWVGTNQQFLPVRKVAMTRPDLRTVDDQLVAFEMSAGLQATQIGSGIGFRKSLTPNDVTPEDLL